MRSTRDSAVWWYASTSTAAFPSALSYCREALPEEVMDRALRTHHVTVRTVGIFFGAYESATEGPLAGVVLPGHKQYFAYCFL